MRYAKFWQAASIAGMFLVLAGALIPADWLWGDKASGWQVSDKLLHGITFAFLAFWFCGQYARSSYWRVAAGLIAFGLLIEVCQQMLVYRTAETLDVAADVAGIAAGLLLSLALTGGWCLKAESILANRRG